MGEEKTGQQSKIKKSIDIFKQTLVEKGISCPTLAEVAGIWVPMYLSRLCVFGLGF